jgi:uncharacterized protein
MAVMRLDELPTSDRIEDRRGLTTSRAGIGVGTVVVLGLIGWALGIDPRLLIGGAEMMSRSGQTQQQTEVGTGTPSDEMGHFVSAILGSTEAEWKEVFDQAGKTYKPPTLVMFTGTTQSGCGFARSAMGPFYWGLWKVERRANAEVSPTAAIDEVMDYTRATAVGDLFPVILKVMSVAGHGNSNVMLR